MIALLAKGFLAGATIAFPIGPVGIMCLRRLLTQGIAVGLASGFGAACADGIFAIFALGSLSFVKQFIAAHTIAFRVMSSIVLCSLGFGLLFKKADQPRPTWSRDIIESFFSTLFLTLANPLIIISLVALFAAFGIAEHATIFMYSTMAYVLGGVLIGSMSWWLLLAFLKYVFNISIPLEFLKKINIASGLFIIFLSLIALVSLFIH